MAATKALEGAPKVVQTLGKLGAKAATSAATTGGITAAQGGSAQDVKNAAILGGVAAPISEGISSLIKNAPKTLWSNLLKRTPTEALKNPTLTEDAAKTGLTGMTRSSISAQAGEKIKQLEIALDDTLSGVKGKISTQKVAGYVKELKDAYKTIPGETSAVSSINSTLEDLTRKKSLSVQDAQQLKKNIYQHIAKSYGKGLMEISPTTEAQKQIARGLKTELEKVAPEIKGINKQMAVYGGIKKALDKTIARQEGKGIAGTGVGLYDLLSGGIGESIGLATGHPLLGIGTIAAKKTAESPAVLSGTSKILKYFDTLSPTKRMLFYQGIKGLTARGITSSP